MMAGLDKCSMVDLEQYPIEFLQIQQDSVHLPVTYMKIWNDGFGARGWKINATIGDPAIIASTRETGLRINTSVFIHDILDHFLSGFGVSGHRSEAMALMQLSKRTGSDPEYDYAQMVREDIIKGHVNGEGLRTFLPASLCAMLPSDTEMTDKQIIGYLRDDLGESCLLEALVQNFYLLGKAGEAHANESWVKIGLDPRNRTEVGLALQDILNKVDLMAEESGVEYLEAIISINNTKCVLKISESHNSESEYNAEVV